MAQHLRYWKSLTNSELLDRLKDLPPDLEYIDVDLSHNELETMPDLKRYQQLKGVDNVNLKQNKIVHLDSNKVPQSVRVLNLNSNKITEMGNLSQHQQLEELNLGSNQITAIDPLNLPSKLKKLHLSWNKLKAVGNFSKLHCLVQLDLTGNKVTHIDPQNTNLSNWTITVFGEEFFETENGYFDVLRYGLKTRYLRQPPTRVFRRGVKAVQMYYKNRKRWSSSHKSDSSSEEEFAFSSENVTEKARELSLTKFSCGEAKQYAPSYTKVTSKVTSPIVREDQLNVVEEQDRFGTFYRQKSMGTKKPMYGLPKAAKTFQTSEQDVIITHLERESDTYGRGTTTAKRKGGMQSSILEPVFVKNLINLTHDSDTPKTKTDSYEVVKKPVDLKHETEHPVSLHKKSFTFTITPYGGTFRSAAENITVYVPPNSINQSEKQCTASVRSRDLTKDDFTQNAVSKVYEFVPNGLSTENRMMFVIPLLPAHSYDYKHMTLIYREAQDSAFIYAETIQENKPTWMFHGNVCYLFLSHFCEMCVIELKNYSGEITENIRLEAMLFCKYSDEELELKTTFGCYNKESACSQQKVTEHYNFLGYKKAAAENIMLHEGKPLYVQPRFPEEEWEQAFRGDGKQMKGYSYFKVMCPSIPNQWPPQFTHKLKRRSNVQSKNCVEILLMHLNFETPLSYDASVLPSDITRIYASERQLNLDMVDGARKIKEIFYMHMSDEVKLACTKLMGLPQTTTDLCGREFTELFLNAFIQRYQGPMEQLPILHSLVTHLGRFPCLWSVRQRLKYLKWKESLETKLVKLCAEEEMESFQSCLTTENVLGDAECHQLQKYPDTFSRLMYLMRNFILNKPENYSKLKEFCQQRPRLQTYVADDILMTDDMQPYDRRRFQLPNLCEECLLCVANVTVGLQEVIVVLGKVGRSFCSFLNHDIITRSTAQRIQKASDDDEALGLIRQAFQDSLEPRKLDILLEVLSIEQMGKRLHAEKIMQYYHREICDHKRCERCTTED